MLSCQTLGLTRFTAVILEEPRVSRGVSKDAPHKPALSSFEARGTRTSSDNGEAVGAGMTAMIFPPTPGHAAIIPEKSTPPLPAASNAL